MAGKTAVEAQEIAGPRLRDFLLHANDFEDALKQAYATRSGCQSSGHVWQAHIRTLDYQGER